MTLGEKIKAIRKQNKLTQIQFAKSLGVSQTHISKIEQGADTPSNELLYRIGNRYNIHFKELLYQSQQRFDNIGFFVSVSLEEFAASLKRYYHFDDLHIDAYYSEIEAHLPQRETGQSSRYNLSCPVDIEINANESVLIPLGIRGCFKAGWVLLIMPHSGLSLEYGLRLENTITAIDSDYEEQIILKVSASAPLKIKAGDRIAQGIFLPFGLISGDSIEDTVYEQETDRLGSAGL